jgi:tRNA(Ile)-lysidine synthase
MALAALYTEARSANNLLPKPHGFIVDHRVRPESTEEAEWVAQQLRSKRRIYDPSSTFKC